MATAMASIKVNDPFLILHIFKPPFFRAHGPGLSKGSGGVENLSCPAQRAEGMARAIVYSRAQHRPALEPLYDIDPETGASVEVFYADCVLAASFGVRPGWFWWTCQSGSLPVASRLDHSLRATQRTAISLRAGYHAPALATHNVNADTVRTQHFRQTADGV